MANWPGTINLGLDCKRVSFDGIGIMGCLRDGEMELAKGSLAGSHSERRGPAWVAADLPL